MNRKQAGIILTLIALIVCVGILATRVNGKLEDAGSLTLNTFPNDSEDAKSNEKKENGKDYFYESRNEREQTDAQTMQSYKSVIEDSNTTKEQKEETTKKLNDLVTGRNYETRIELSLKSKGFDDALCLIGGDKVRVIVKADEQLTEKQTIQIQESVYAVAKTKDVIIEVKQ
ncbi:SpoIIIAH-like family protein [Clostridium fallax]|uniref:Stage III sporulation protein AH n=1 Tax=Clostridium fallax TaxID=1533 RepID=A0A1M4XMJ8_9CLOT|nr:SpoIIIAH-like family protein [Clostridium fallax]SHE94719.1 stage III sporulation protein AH [Clostridium fallax]SQB06344.1 stage III sporulation protein AH [Clostridium fallax]